MAERVASILAEIGIDASKFGSGVQDILNGLDGVSGAFSEGAVVAAGYAAAIAIVSEQYWKAVDAAEEAAVSQAKIDAVLKATGNAAGLTSDQLSQMADDLAVITGIDDDVIKSTEAVMLTFKNIRGDNFRQAMEAAADLSAVMDGDLKGSALQVSKALNDFSGYTALRRAGVSFSEVQERQIKNFKETNDLAGYQRLVLQELQGEFGGTSKAINDAGDGSANLNKAIGDLYENVGGLLLPEVRNLNRELTQLINTVNQNWASITKLWYALEGVRRTMQAIGSLGVSEIVRWWMGGGGDGLEPPPGADKLPTKQNAIGGSFLIPQSYGREGFRLGNGDTASAGERITITPANGGGTSATLTVRDINIGNASDLSREEVTGMLKQALWELMQ